MTDNSSFGIQNHSLQMFVGKWNTTGHVFDANNLPSVYFFGTDIYEWLPGNYALLHKVDIQMGETKKQNIEIMGYDAKAGVYLMHYFDAAGDAGTMQATFNGKMWTFVGEDIRFAGGFSADEQAFSGVWERLQNGNWKKWMNVKLIRQTS